MGKNIYAQSKKGDQFDAFLYKYLSISYNNNSDIAKRMKCTQENLRKLLMRGLEKLAKNIQ